MRNRNVNAAAAPIDYSGASSMRAFGVLRNLALAACLLARAFAADPQELARRAQSAMAAARYSEAVVLYRNLLKEMPEDPGVRFNYGLALESTGDYNEAIVQLERVVHDAPAMTNAWLILGLAHSKRGEPELAIDPLHRVLKAEPQNKLALFELADAYLSTGDFDAAAAHFSRLAQIDPESPKAWHGLYAAWTARAQVLAERLKNRAMDSAWRAALAGASRFEQGRAPEAVALFGPALETHPELALANPELAKASGFKAAPDCGSGSFACAFAKGDFEHVLALAPASPADEAFYWKWAACRALAGRALDRLSALPESPELHEVLGERYRLAGRKEDSVREWRAAVRLAPRDAYASHGLAKALWLHRDYAEARPIVERLLKASPQSPELNFELGDILLELQNVEASLPWLEKAVRLSPGAAAAQGSLGRALLRKGDAAASIPHLEAALPTDEDGSLHYQLGRAYQQTGNALKAQQCFEEQRRIVAANGGQ